MQPTFSLLSHSSTKRPVMRTNMDSMVKNFLLFLVAFLCGFYFCSIVFKDDIQKVASAITVDKPTTQNYKQPENKRKERMDTDVIRHNGSTPSFNKPSDRIIQKYQEQVRERKQLLAQTPEDNGTTMEPRKYARIYNYLAPEVFCAEEIKVGTTDDGGKWMCGPYNLPDECVIVSLGFNNLVSFEKDLQKMTNKRCRIVGVDMNEQAPKTKALFSEIRGTAIKGKVSTLTNSTTGEISMDDVMKKFDIKEIEILKIDIEEAEFLVIPDFLKKHRVSQLLIEVHGKAKVALKLLQTIASFGYHVFHYEINGEWHHLCEYAFIHESAFKKYQATTLARYLA